jgi:hypothetical protein
MSEMSERTDAELYSIIEQRETAALRARFPGEVGRDLVTALTGITLDGICLRFY